MNQLDQLLENGSIDEYTHTRLMFIHQSLSSLNPKNCDEEIIEIATHSSRLAQGVYTNDALSIDLGLYDSLINHRDVMMDNSITGSIYSNYVNAFHKSVVDGYRAANAVQFFGQSDDQMRMYTFKQQPTMGFEDSIVVSDQVLGQDTFASGVEAIEALREMVEHGNQPATLTRPSLGYFVATTDSPDEYLAMSNEFNEKLDKYIENGGKFTLSEISEIHNHSRELDTQQFQRINEPLDKFRNLASQPREELGRVRSCDDVYEANQHFSRALFLETHLLQGGNKASFVEPQSFINTSKNLSRLGGMTVSTLDHMRDYDAVTAPDAPKFSDTYPEKFAECDRYLQTMKEVVKEPVTQAEEKKSTESELEM